MVRIDRSFVPVIAGLSGTTERRRGGEVRAEWCKDEQCNYCELLKPLPVRSAFSDMKMLILIADIYVGHIWERTKSFLLKAICMTKCPHYTIG